MALGCGHLLGVDLGKLSLKLLYFHRHLHMGNFHARTCLIECVDGLVGEIAVAHIAVGELHASLKGVVGVCDAVMILILTFDIIEDCKSLLGSGGLNHDFLEAAFESAVFLNIDAVLIERCSADTLNLATGKCRFEHVCSVHRALSIACAYNRVNLVDKKYDVGILGEFIENRLYALLKFAAVFCAGYNRSHIKRNHTLVVKNTRNLALGDTQSKTFDDGRLADAGLTDEHGIIFLAAAENLRETLNLDLTAHDGIKSALLCRTSHVMTEFVEHGSVVSALATEFILSSGLDALGTVGSLAFGLGGIRIAAALGSRGVCIGLQLGFELTCNAVVIDTGIDERRYESHIAHILVVEQRQEQVLHINELRFHISRLDDGEFDNKSDCTVEEVGVLTL